MNKKERVIAAIRGEVPDHVPSGFSLHFPRVENTTEEDVRFHLDFFRETDTDIIKIMNENLVPDFGEIRTPRDWNKIPKLTLKDSFMQKQIELTKRILDKADPDAFLLGTLHGICASAIHPIEARYGYEAVRELQAAHFRENKEPMLDAWKRIAECMTELARTYIELGVNGVYYAALGAERRYFTDEEFAECIAPFDKQILQAVKEAGGYTFLHMCKDGLNMQRYASYRELCDVVNWGIYEAPFTIEEGKALFGDVTIMGGLANRSGVMVDGTIEELKEEVRGLIAKYGKKGFIVGADCTLPTEIPYERIRAITEAAREV